MAHTICPNLCSPGYRRSAFSFQLKALFFSIGVLLNVSLAADEKKSFDVPAGEALATLKQAAQQAGAEIVFTAETVQGVRTNAVKGSMSAREALAAMVADTDLHIVQDEKTGALAVTKNGKNDQGAVPLSGNRPASRLKVEDGVVKMATFEVMGSKLLNMDIKRSVDDPQPYLVLDRAKIERSGAANLEELLKRNLPMNTMESTTSQQMRSAASGASRINLRGLGTNQTLILIDGRRTATFIVSGNPQQTDINGIPLGAVERIEVLPTTASGLYGGSATGGVINIVLRRDYAGYEVKFTRSGSLDGGGAENRVDLSAGLDLEGGKTNVLIAASYRHRDALLYGERDIIQRYRELVGRISPATFYSAATPLLGATSNIRSTTGVNLTLKSSGAALNSPITYIPYGYGGVAVDNGAALIANAGKYNLDLPKTAQANGTRSPLLDEPTVASVNVTVRRKFTPRLQAFLELGGSNRTSESFENIVTQTYIVPATAAVNPFNQAVRVTVPTLGGDGVSTLKVFSRRAVAGVIVTLPKDWQAELDHTWTWMRQSSNRVSFTSASATSAITSGAIDVFRDLNVHPADFSPYWSPSITQSEGNTLNDSTLRVAGPVYSLPAGAAMLSALAEHRRESFGAEKLFQPGLNQALLYPEKSQTTDSAYVELNVPVVGEANQLPLVRSLQLQVAGRRDSYRTTGTTNTIDLNAPTPINRFHNRKSSFDPTVALKYSPVADVALRASYGTGFLPPAVNQLVPRTDFSFDLSFFGITDPRRGNEAIGRIPILLGGNPNLRPELSKTWSAGAILTPRLASGLRVSIDWSRTTKRDNLAIPGNWTSQTIFDREALIPGLITRAAPAAGDPYPVGRVTGMNGGFYNIASTEVESIDFAVDYHRALPAWGEMKFSLNATRLLHYKTQLVPQSPVDEAAGAISPVDGDPLLKWKGNATVSWSHRGWQASWMAHYYDPYWYNTAHTVVAVVASARQPRQVYHGVQVSYRFDRMGGPLRLLSGLELQAGVSNVFRRQTPLDGWAPASSPYSRIADPLGSKYYVSVKRSF